jgi:hypothetical protein
MVTRELARRLRRLEDAASRRAAATTPPPPLRSEAVEWERTLEVLEALIECGELPMPPPDCATEHDVDGGLCEQCNSWQHAVERHVSSRDEAGDRWTFDIVRILAEAEAWPLSEPTWRILHEAQQH